MMKPIKELKQGARIFLNRVALKDATLFVVLERMPNTAYRELMFDEEEFLTQLRELGYQVRKPQEARA